jgi:flagellar biosynthesis chaperone FliJ
MDSLRTRVSGFFRKWQRAREEARRTNDARRDQRAADELDQAKVNRFPPMGG